MRLTKEQFAKIEHLMPIPRRKPEVSNYDFLCALLYIIENGCKWRALPNEYGNWHTIYVRFNRWCKNGVIDPFHYTTFHAKKPPFRVTFSTDCAVRRVFHSVQLL